MKIDGVTVEPSLADDPDSIGHTALDIDCDLDALALKMQMEVQVSDYKTIFGGRIRSCFTGRDAVDWCVRKAICSDELDAVHVLNRMIRRGLMHHHNLSALMENSPTAYYRFPQDHFKILVDQTGSSPPIMYRLRPRAKTVQGETALQEVWYADVPMLPMDKVRNLGQVLERLNRRDIQRGFRRHLSCFPGKEAVETLIEAGVAKNVTDALAIGNAFLRAGLFHHIHLKAPLRNDDSLYRLAKCQHDILMNRECATGLTANVHHAYSGDTGMDESRLTYLADSTSELNDLDTQGRSALELASSSRYWTSYRASKLYVLNLYVLEGFIDMSEDWDSHVDQLFPTYCECYLTRDKDATTHTTIVSQKTLHPVWNCPVAFVDVDYLDAIRIDIKAHTQLGNDINIGSLEFPAHKVMGARNDPIVVEFDCGSKQFAECAAAIIKVQFDPAVAGPADGGELDKHHLLLMNGAGDKDDSGSNSQENGRRSHTSRTQVRRSMRGSIRRASFVSTTEDMDPVYINVEGPQGCVLLDDDSGVGMKTRDSFTSLALGLMGGNGSISSTRSSLHTLPGWWDPDRMNATGAAGVRRSSVASSEARRGSLQSDLPDIIEDNELNVPWPPTAAQQESNLGMSAYSGSTGHGGGLTTASTMTGSAHGVADLGEGNETGITELEGAIGGASLGNNNSSGSRNSSTNGSTKNTNNTSGNVGNIHARNTMPVDQAAGKSKKDSQGRAPVLAGSGVEKNLPSATARALRRTSWGPESIMKGASSNALGNAAALAGASAIVDGGGDRAPATVGRRLSWGPTSTTSASAPGGRRE